ncbi:MAG: segregation/condensation protein A [Bdellovibrionaceae bacterium]|nr:segregation/condensation protein A [Pseudobdellovibrionaceae bacterium]MBX3034293.1 segregation/condensation protein A [Pseudobdellovibrionaceae bacterium]
MTNQITVQLPHFEGPLGLLLYLIRKDEMDIMDIKIHEITSQYLDYIKLMKELDIEVAGEFIAMAATLIHIKSRMLLPQYDENGEIVETEDPRKELVQKLLEYQKYQEAAKLLYERPLVGRDLWLRGHRERLNPKEEEIEVDESGLFGLITSYRRLLRAAHKRVHKVAAKTKSIAGRILEMKDRLVVGARLTLQELVTSTEEKARETLITFLSLLELGKLGFVRLAQTEPYADIWIVTQKPVEADAISRVEEYDNLHADEVAERLTEKAEPPARGEDFALMSTAEGDAVVFEGAMSAEFIAAGGTGEDDLLKEIENLKLELSAGEAVEGVASDDDILAAEAETDLNDDSSKEDLDGEA